MASEDAETPVTTAAESDPVGATETEIETATETEAAPETEAVAEPATEQVASDGQSEPMVGFDDVAWRLRAYLADDSSVPVPANEEASANEETSAAQKEAESVATSTANASNPVDPEERAEAAPPSEDTGDADVFADSAESETTAQEPAVTESAIPEPAVAEPTVAEVPEPELTETTKVAAVVPDPAPAPIPAPAPAPVAEEQPEVEPSEPVAAETKPEASKPFQVQLASVKTEEGAMAEWKRMQKQVNKILPDAEPHFVRAEVRGKGVLPDPRRCLAQLLGSACPVRRHRRPQPLLSGRSSHKLSPWNCTIVMRGGGRSSAAAVSPWKLCRLFTGFLAVNAL